jgi:hypothetical protein
MLMFWQPPAVVPFPLCHTINRAITYLANQGAGGEPLYPCTPASCLRIASRTNILCAPAASSASVRLCISVGSCAVATSRSWLSMLMWAAVAEAYSRHSRRHVSHFGESAILNLQGRLFEARFLSRASFSFASSFRYASFGTRRSLPTALSKRSHSVLPGTGGGGDGFISLSLQTFYRGLHAGDRQVNRADDMYAPTFSLIVYVLIG